MSSKKHKGQALVEYLMLFALLLFILLQLVRGINAIVGESFGRLRVILSKELTTGMCSEPRACLHSDRYKN